MANSLVTISSPFLVLDLMRMWMKGLGVLLTAGVTVGAWAQGIQVSVDGQHVPFGAVGPQSVRGHLLVPIRGLFEYLGAVVHYRARQHQVVAERGAKRIAITLGQNLATVGDEEVVLEVPARQVNGSTMVPLRFVGESLGADVKWDPSTKSVEISTTAQPQ